MSGQDEAGSSGRPEGEAAARRAATPLGDSMPPSSSPKPAAVADAQTADVSSTRHTSPTPDMAAPPAYTAPSLGDNRSPRPPALELTSSSPNPSASVLPSTPPAQDSSSPLDNFHAHSTVEVPLRSPATIENTDDSHQTHQASSTSVLLPDLETSGSTYPQWVLPASELRPDTTELENDPQPRHVFFAQSGSDISTGSSELQEDQGLFAFHRPMTAGGVVNLAQQDDSPAPTPIPSPYGPVDVGGHISRPTDTYDPSSPAQFAGRNNLNTSAYLVRRRASETPMQEVGSGRHSHEVHASALSRSTTASSAPESEYIPASAGHDGHLRPPTSRARIRDDVSVISESAVSESEMGTRAPPTARSYGMTELTGDATVPDGQTTWGDGQGGEFKDDESGSQADWMEEDSPYAEVRVSVSNIDDPEMPALTLRAFVLGMLLCILACGANTFFSFRNPTPRIPILVVQVLAYPIGKFLAWVLPIRVFTAPRLLGGWSFSLNPCPFNVKEHTIIVMMASVAILPAYGLYTIVTTQLFYERDLGIGFSIVFILASQLTGLSMAGIARRFVVWPASMIWPGVLVTTTNLNTLHAEADMGSGGMSRLRFFVYASLAAFVWYFFPGFIFRALSNFNWACWIAPTNLTVNQLMGIHTGLGMGILTFDWSQIAWIGSPLTAPWWAQVNVGIGFLMFYWLIVPIMYYQNVWSTKWLPIQAIQAADRFQSVYNVTKVLTPDHGLNETAYAQYSPVYLTAAFTMTYMLAFALTTSLLVYTALNHGPRIWRAIRRVKAEPDDIHMKLMSVYPEVPDWWYMISFALCAMMGILSIELFHTDLPVWGYIVSIAIAFVYIVPTGIIYAMTNLEPAFNLIAELIPGYAFKGMPLPGMLFKAFAVQTLTEALYFVRDMKLGHYMKVPPRSMFVAQMAACSVSCFVQIGVKEWMFATVPDICANNQPALLVCSNAKTYFTSSVIWGLIGPARLFDKGGIYRPQLWMLFVGAITPIPVWWFCKKYPKSILRNLNVVLVFSVCLFTPPASGINIASFLVVGFLFQFWIRRYAFPWWSKYNYVLSAALDVGTLSSAIFIFLVLWLPKVKFKWWGNTVYGNTLDFAGLAFPQLPRGEFFGPSTWKV